MRTLFGIALLLLGAPQPTDVRITVRITGLRPAQGGVVHVALHPTPGAGFPGHSAWPRGNEAAPVRADEITLSFEAPPGTYAVAVHHDGNANGKMDANFFGVPKEGYAVSNDARPRFRPPRFREAQVTVTRDTTLLVRMAY